MPELIEAYGNVKIMSTDESSMPMYIVMPPKLSEAESKIVQKPKDLISNWKELIKELEEYRTAEEKEEFIMGHIKDLLKDKGVSPENMDVIMKIIMDDLFMGYGRLGPLMRDDLLEEIMVNGIGLPVFIVHRKHGMCATNVEYETPESIFEIINWLSKYSGRAVDAEKPLLDAHMPDGSRVNVAIAPAAPNGPSITIRKFKKVPLNVMNLIKYKTISVDLAAFLWLCVDGLKLHPCNIMVAGGTGSGKTTLLNVLATFMPSSDRVITVEDTLELNFDFIENWVALEASSSVLGKTKIDAEALVINTLRMRPDRIVIGEVRGREAYNLFVAMDIGLDGSMGTIHANTARDTTLRLMDAPMEIPIRMMPLCDLIVVMNRHFFRGRGTVRRITEVTEIAGIEKDVVQLGDIYKWDPGTDEIKRTEYPIILKDKIAEGCSVSKKQINAELFVREKIFEYMLKKNISDNKRVIDILHMYKSDPDALLKKINPKLMRYVIR